MNYMLNGVEVKVGQVWESPSGVYKVKVITFTSVGIPVVEYQEPHRGVAMLTNIDWYLVPEKKVLKYQVFKHKTTGEVFIVEDRGTNFEVFSSSDEYAALSPILEYEYTDE